MLTKIAKFNFDLTHFGEIGIGVENVQETLHSDTIFSALCHAWGLLFGKADLEKLLEDFLAGSSPFLISSGFVYNGDTYFLPKPQTIPPGFAEVAQLREEFGKKVKKISYLPLKIFEKWARREEIDYKSMKDSFPDYKSSFQYLLIPRVALDRATSSSQIFHSGAIRFSSNCGLYCLVRINASACETKIRMALSLLGDLGLGGERTYGLGRFTLAWNEPDDSWERLFSFEGDAHCCLSLFYPENLAGLPELAENASYNVLSRRGWLYSPFTRKQYKRQRITMFAEGSVFSKPVQGKLVDVTPAVLKSQNGHHPIYRYGYAFTVPIKEYKEQNHEDNN